MKEFLLSELLDRDDVPEISELSSIGPALQTSEGLNAAMRFTSDMMGSSHPLGVVKLAAIVHGMLSVMYDKHLSEGGY